MIPDVELQSGNMV
uniref:Uncharacterized protein n=1 Tax=Anguilla anguilla TaxID=7936 RepID=A0A0E9UTJ3_ANGAN